MTLDRQESGPSLKILSHDIKRRGRVSGFFPHRANRLTLQCESR